MVAFDRFLARLIQGQPDQWARKGALALQLRLGDKARMPKDLDVLAFTAPQEITKALRETGKLDLGDWFSFKIAEPSSRLASQGSWLKENLMDDNSIRCTRSAD